MSAPIDVRDRDNVTLYELLRIQRETGCDEMLVSTEQATNLYDELGQQVWFDEQHDDGRFSPRMPAWRSMVIHTAR